MQFKNYKDIAAFAKREGFHVTSTTGGRHNVGSKHGRGLAIDVRTRDKTPQQCEAFIAKCRDLGLIVRDERVRPQRQRVWSGAHLHIEIAGDRPAAVSSDSVIGFGDKGVRVVRIQQRLFEIGLLTQKDVDGIFNATTQSAVQKFQHSKGLDADGIVGTETTTALFPV